MFRVLGVSVEGIGGSDFKVLRFRFRVLGVSVRRDRRFRFSKFSGSGLGFWVFL